MEKHLEADSQFQVFLKDFHTAFGIEHPSQVMTEQREILAASIRMDAVVTFDDDFFFTKISERIFPWLGKINVFEFKGKNDPLQAGQYYQYAFAELGLMFALCLSAERKERSGRQWMSQKATRAYWKKLKNQGAQHLCCAIIMSTGDPRGLRKSLRLEPVNQYQHLQGALYRQIISQNELVGSIAVYLVVLNKLKVCPINAPLLLLSKGQKQKEFCRWLLTDAEGLTLEEQARYKAHLVTYNLIEYEEVQQEMRRNIWKPDPNVMAELIEEYPGGVEAFFQKTFPKMRKHIWKSHPDVITELIEEFPGGVEAFILKVVKTKEQRRRLIELLQQDDDEAKE